jgi:hypothetical protein
MGWHGKDRLARDQGGLVAANVFSLRAYMPVCRWSLSGWLVGGATPIPPAPYFVEASGDGNVESDSRHSHI